MALLFMDSFDHYATADLTAKWATDPGGAATATTSPVPRTGLRRLNVTKGYTLTSRVLPVSGGVAVIGFAFQVSGLVDGDFLLIQEGATIHMALELTAAGAINVQRNNTTLASSADGVIAANGWFHIEFKTTIHDSAGTYEVKIDGSTVVSGTGADTQNGGTATWDTVVLCGPGVIVGGGATGYFDDFYACDGSGSTCNTFLGNSQVLCVFPSTDAVAAGTYADFTPSSGSDAGAMVDDTTPDGDTTYNAGVSVNQKDSYHYPALGSGETVRGIQVNAYMKKTDAGARTTAPFIRSGGSDYVGATISPITTYRYEWEVMELDPDTGVTWTESGIDAAEFGVKIIS